jgi:hypothetical protein
MRKIILMAVCWATATAANAAVFQYQFPTYYGANSTCSTSSMLAATSPATVLSIPINRLNVDDLWGSGMQLAAPSKLFLEGGRAAADFLASAPAPVNEAPVCSPPILGNSVSLYTPLASTTTTDGTKVNLSVDEPIVLSPAVAETGTLVLSGVGSDDASISPASYPAWAGFSGISSSIGFTVSGSTPLPEASSWAAFGLGLAAVAGAIRLRRNQPTVI